MSTTTSFMGLIIPDVNITPGPAWATLLNNALEVVDSHDHSSGKGRKITPLGLNINTDMTFNSKRIYGVNYLSLDSLSSNPADTLSIFAKNNDLYYKDGAGNVVRVTNSGALDISAVGGIGGDYTSSGASAIYSSITSKYTLYTPSAVAATLIIGGIDIDPSGSSQITGTPTFTGVVTFNQNVSMSQNLTVSGNSSLTGNSTIGGTLNVTGIVTHGDATVLKGDVTFGSSATASDNIKLRRAGVGLIQAVTANDSAAEGTLSTNLAQISFKLEQGATGSLPSPTSQTGRIVYDTSLSKIKVSDGTVFRSIGPGNIEDFELSEDLAAGDIVTLTPHSTLPKVEKIDRFARIGYSAATTFTTVGTWIASIYIPASSTYVGLSSVSSTLYLTPYTVASDGAVTLGTAFSLMSSTGIDFLFDGCLAYHITSDKIVFIYTDATFNVKLVPITYSSGTFTVGTAATVTTNANLFGLQRIFYAKNGNFLIALVVKNASTDDMIAYKYTLSGAGVFTFSTSLTIHSGVTNLSTGGAIMCSSAVTTASTGNTFASYDVLVISSNNELRALNCTAMQVDGFVISASTYNIGLQTAPFGTYSDYSPMVFDPTTNILFIGNELGHVHSFSLCTHVYSSLTYLGTSSNIYPTSPSSTGNVTKMLIDTYNKLLIILSNGGGGFMVAKILPSSFVVAYHVQAANNGTGFYTYSNTGTGTVINESTGMITTSGATPTSAGVARAYSFYFKTPENYLGMIIESGTTGQTKSVALLGSVAIVPTSRNPGTKVYLQRDGTVGTTPTLYPVYKHLTATKVLLTKNP